MLTDIFYHSVPFLGILISLVFVHEFGHYWVARRNGVHVEVFSIGLGPEIWGCYDKHGTRWRISLFPLGGYVRMLSDADAASSGVDHEALAHMSAEDKARTYHFKTPWQKIQVAAAGPIANYIFALLLLVMFVTVGEKLPSNNTVIGIVHEGTTADKAGLRVGDNITKIDHHAVHTFEDIALYTRARPGQNIVIVFQRQKDTLHVTAALESRSVKENGQDRTIGVLGVEQSRSYQKRGFLEAIRTAAYKTVFITWMSLKSIGQMIMGNRSTKDLMGPLGIAKSVASFAKSDVASLISVAAFLSISLGFINLLPIPVLDGGQIMMHTIEAIRGKPLNERAQEIVSWVGLGIVLSLFVVSTWNDVNRLTWIKNLLNRH